jgi:hypothetical protein
MNGELRCTLIFFVLLVFGCSLIVPAEDLLETTYDESETQPSSPVPPFSIRLLPAPAWATQSVGSTAGPHLYAAIQSFGITDSKSHRSAAAPVALDRLSVLRC